MKLYDDSVQTILECCKRISEADPKTDHGGQNALYAVGQKLFMLGDEPAMQHACMAASEHAHTHGNQWMIAGLCNSTWHGIGTWSR